MIPGSVIKTEVWTVGFEVVSEGLEICFAYPCFLKKSMCSVQKYLLPLIMGGKEDRKQLQRIESNIAEMSGSVTQTGKD